MMSKQGKPRPSCVSSKKTSDAEYHILVQVPGLAVDVMRIFCHTDCGNPYDMISYDFVVIRIEARAESQDLK